MLFRRRLEVISCSFRAEQYADRVVREVPDASGVGRTRIGRRDRDMLFGEMTQKHGQAIRGHNNPAIGEFGQVLARIEERLAMAQPVR